MNFGNILSTTWKTIWKHKVIIWFGLLMVILPALMGLLMGGVFAFTSMENLEAFFNSPFDSGIFAIIMILAYLGFMLLFFVLYALSLTGVYKGTILLRGKEDSLSFRELWEASTPYLGRLIGVLLVVGLAMFIVFTLPLIFGALVGALTAGIGFLCMMPFMFLLMPLGLVSYLALSLSTAAVVVDDLGIMDAIQHTWALMQKKIWPLVLMTVILYFIQMAVGMVIVIPMQIIQFAFIFPMSTGEIDPNSIFRIYGIFMALFIPISSLVQSLGLTYVNAAWALTYADGVAPDQVSGANDDDIVEFA